VIKAKDGYTHSKAYLQRVREIEQQFHSNNDLYSSVRMRNRIEAIVEDKVWTLWAFVRENRNSLNSDGVCKRIRAAVQLGVEEIAEDATAMAAENEKLQEKIKDLNKQIKDMKESASAKKY
jgi:hypothetical protein